jgi:hypothetical protein
MSSRIFPPKSRIQKIQIQKQNPTTSSAQTQSTNHTRTNHKNANLPPTTMALRITEHISKELRQLSGWSEFELKRTKMAVTSAQSVQLDNRDEILLMAK